MPTKAEINTLPEHLREGWDLLGPGFQTAIHTQLERERRNGTHISLEFFLSKWAFQTVPGEIVARCAATGVEFTPTGLGSPRLFRLDADRGMDPENLVLVSQAYWRLRIMGRTFGHEGHRAFYRWVKQVAANDFPEVRLTEFGEDVDEDQLDLFTDPVDPEAEAV